MNTEVSTRVKIRTANAPCSWGVLEFDLEGKSAAYEQVLDEMKQTGYVGTELGDWGFMPTDPDELKEELSKRQLEMVAAFVPVELANERAHAEGISRAVKTAKLLFSVNDRALIVLADDNGKHDARTKNAGRIRKDHWLTAEQWSIFRRGSEDLARTVLEETGLRTVFHHHCAGFVETPEEVSLFLQLTDPELIGLCFDTGHYSFGGGNAVEGINRHFDRIWHVHFKDFDPAVHARSRQNDWDYFESVKNGIFCELGKGAVDFAAITDLLKARGYEGWIVVEQDVLPGMGSPLESAKRNREYLKQLQL